MLLQVIDDAPGYLKATFQGPQGSGKTFTATELAVYCHKVFSSKKPVAFYDTETGSDYIADKLAEGTGHRPLRVKTRAFRDLLDVAQECIDGAADVLIIDSITHVWRELGDAWMSAINEGRRYAKTRMDMQDIMGVKKQWEPWPNLFLNAPIHIIVCGREGNEWGNEENEETGKRDLIQVGKKMKVEGEFGYEASLQIAMEARQEMRRVVKKRGGKREATPRSIYNVATVLKDRFDLMNGAEIESPKGESFAPHIDRLRPALHGRVDTSTKSQNLIQSDDGEYAVERRARTILAEEVTGELHLHYPGQSARDKAMRFAAMFEAFGTRSWTAVEGKTSGELRRGLDFLRDTLGIPEKKTAFEGRNEEATPAKK